MTSWRAAKDLTEFRDQSKHSNNTKEVAAVLDSPIGKTNTVNYTRGTNSNSISLVVTRNSLQLVDKQADRLTD